MSLLSAGANATISTFAGMVIFFSPPLWEGLPFARQWWRDYEIFEDVTADLPLFALVGPDLDEGDPRGVVDADVDELPTDAKVTIYRAGISSSDACPTEPMRPSFLMSRWMSSPGFSRS